MGEKYVCGGRRCRERLGCNFTGRVGDFNDCSECAFGDFESCPADDFTVRENMFCPKCASATESERQLMARPVRNPQDPIIFFSKVRMYLSGVWCYWLNQSIGFLP